MTVVYDGVVSVAANAVSGNGARRVAARLMRQTGLPGGYRTDLCLLGLLCLYDATGDARYLAYVREDIRGRGATMSDTLNWKYVFTDIHSDLWIRTGDVSDQEGWLEDVHDFDRRLPRDEDGCIVFFVEPEKKRLLIDLLQGYAVRMARAGLLTESPVYQTAVCHQYRRYAHILVNPRTGLWHHGRGWHDGDSGVLSPDGWCRGQAWVVRGLVESLFCIEGHSPLFAPHLAHLTRLGAALLKHQAPDGMWYQMMTDPACSYPETSGTGMLVYYLGRAVQNGWLPETEYIPALRKAQAALESFVDDEGRVSNGCPHGPPLTSVEAYNARKPEVDDPHAIAGVLMAGSLTF